ncbi:succinylglutamate desuccinylase [Verticiella sediminum]|uniref:Succinylglutamate desuccinylase n=1 Tax=Verticiella sediminum TaxID=1247510 RepID=A0A556AUK9_9BURK|nr:succinylglutamate desuccinylase/aspartoacylase family protein [Verticiella sediminum]TSH96628.1 succinylglutamate desuccinylase [Verticiella sediminum]
MTDSGKSLITATVNFDKGGIQTGFLRIPHSVDRSAYGYLPIPVFVAVNGEGPTVLMLGANHGDEYEGPIGLMHLLHGLALERLQGRLIVLPTLNLPAVLAGTRTSPIDKVNLNRSFPGKRHGTPTEMLAHYIETELISQADFVFDFHSGGKTLSYLPILFVLRPTDAASQSLTDRIVRAFGCERVRYIDQLAFNEDRTSGAAARRRGAVFLSGEFGGCGSVSKEGVTLVEQGTLRVLHELGVLGADDEISRPALVNIQSFNYSRAEHYVYAPRGGLFEPSFSLGDSIVAGQRAGFIHDPAEPWNAPREVLFQADGLAICYRPLAHVEAGDCLAHLAIPEAS